jgi:hypothetical protein
MSKGTELEALINFLQHNIALGNGTDKEFMSERGVFELKALEIALASLTAPDDIPPHVLDSMSDMCDGGFDAQGIWDLCRASIMPPTPCPRCGCSSSRPKGEHYCHPSNKPEASND